MRKFAIHLYITIHFYTLHYTFYTFMHTSSDGGGMPWTFIEIPFSESVKTMSVYTWVKVFRIIPEFRILRLTFLLKFLF